MTNLIKISEVAKLLGVSRQRVYQLIEEKRIVPIELYGIKLIDADTLPPDLIKQGREKPMKKPKGKTLIS